MDELIEDGEFPVPLGSINEVAFPVTKGTLEDEPDTPPAVLEDASRDPGPVEPAGIVELA